MRIIVSLTSWHKRIEQAKTTVHSLLNQTRKPDAVYLNLDTINFPNKLPQWIEECKAEHDNFFAPLQSIDLKVWQKIMPTIWRLDGDFADTIIVTADDDVTYPETYLEEIERNMQDCDWLCTKSNEYTMGQYMVYGTKAIAAIDAAVDLDLIKNIPLDDHAIYWILQRYNCKRGKCTSTECEDRQAGYSFRRFFIETNDVSQLQDTTCEYPTAQFEKERAYLRKRGIIDR